MEDLPEARKEGLVTRQFDDELLIYDERRDKMLCLNFTAAFVWKSCNGSTSVRDISERLSCELKVDPNTVLDERFVWYAIAQLDRVHLLQRRVEIPDEVTRNSGISHLEMVRRAGLANLTALPLIVTVSPRAPGSIASGGDS